MRIVPKNVKETKPDVVSFAGCFSEGGRKFFGYIARSKGADYPDEKCPATTPSGVQRMSECPKFPLAGCEMSLAGLFFISGDLASGK